MFVAFVHLRDLATRVWHSPIPIHQLRWRRPKQSWLLLKRQLKELASNPVPGFPVGLADDHGPEATLFEEGFIKARLSFPVDYPLMPPKMKFLSSIWHPNVYDDGNVCISILHSPDDQYGCEAAAECWLPVHTVETIVVRVVSMLSRPHDESPVNLDAAKEWREDFPTFKVWSSL
ncbi:ubiquitin-conjugating enzyme/RWD-like protein [Cladochytrium replicatum]|nr:ubiquitin-conjugating enzyme/RWD-like protein [Cladochytrium replicatum]